MLKEAFSVIQKYIVVYLIAMFLIIGGNFGHDLGVVSGPVYQATTILWLTIGELAAWAIVFSDHGVFPDLIPTSGAHFRGFYLGYTLKALVLVSIPGFVAAGLIFVFFEVRPENRDSLLKLAMIVFYVLVSLFFGVAGTWLPASIKNQRTGFEDALGRARRTFRGVFIRLMLTNAGLGALTLSGATFVFLIEKQWQTTGLFGGPWSIVRWIYVLGLFCFQTLATTYISVVISRAYLSAEQSLSPTRDASASPMDGADGIA